MNNPTTELSALLATEAAQIGSMYGRMDFKITPERFTVESDAVTEDLPPEFLPRRAELLANQEFEVWPVTGIGKIGHIRRNEVHYARRCCKLLVGTAALIASGALFAQQASLSSSLGVYVFPAKNQTAQTQSADEGSCYGWARTQTGIDPMAVKPATDAAQAHAAASSAGNGAVVKGTVGGAAGGAAIGAIAGNPGRGAEIGAGVGLLGGIAKRHAEMQAAAQQQQQQQTAAAQKAQTSMAQQKATYNKAYSACMEGKGYTVR